jgi:integrase
MPLSDIQVRSAKPIEGKTRKLSDGGGLQLWVTPTGSKLWNVAYRINGKQRKLSLGLYPTTSLKAAREGREALKKQLAAGADPSQQKRQATTQKANSDAATFNVIAAELLEKKRRAEKAEQTLTKSEWLLRLASPSLGNRPISEITAPEILTVLQVAEARGKLETAKRLRETIGQVFRHAIASGRAKTDPTLALRGALASPKVRHHAAIIEPKAFGGLLRAISSYEGAPETRFALELLALTFVRPGELRASEWSEFDLGNAVWSIPACKMKMKRPHKVPLSSRALEVLSKLQMFTRQGRLLFPSVRTPTKSISENTINAALRRMGFTKDEMCGHGFRSTASSILNESGLWSADAIERQLAHVDDDATRRAYARAEYWEERVRMMAWWGDKLDEMRKA